MAKIQGQATSCANSIGQKAGIAALSGDQKCVDFMKSKCVFSTKIRGVGKNL